MLNDLTALAHKYGVSLVTLARSALTQARANAAGRPTRRAKIAAALLAAPKS